MALEFIPTRSEQGHPAIQAAITRLQAEENRLGIADGVLYYGWPKFQDYDAVGHEVDLALLSERTGLVLIRFVAADQARLLQEADESIAQAAATAEAQMLKSAQLRGPKRRLKFEVTPVVYSPGGAAPAESTAEFATSEAGLLELVEEVDDQRISPDDLDEARSILEGAKALTRSIKRRVENPAQHPAAGALAILEEEIAKFDAQQRTVALTALRCPQRIRGLAGSGKT